MRQTVKPMRAEDMKMRVDYLHGASDDLLAAMGVDRALLPPPAEWLAMYAEDFARPLAERRYYGVMWLLDDVPVGFSSLSEIEFGHQAYMHLHMVDPHQRRSGLGVGFVQQSTEVYFDQLRLQRIFSEPHAFNVAPNRTLQNAGFRYLSTQVNTPGPINVEQTTNLWVLERP